MKIIIDISSSEDGKNTAMAMNIEGKPDNKVEDLIASVMTKAIRQAGAAMAAIRPDKAMVLDESKMAPGEVFPNSAQEAMKKCEEIKAQKEQRN